MTTELLNKVANYNLEENLEKTFPVVWLDLMNNNQVTSVSNPIGILLGGQPGAGKSFATIQIKERLNNNVLVINGDEFRPYHTHYDDLYLLYGKKAPEHTGAFAGKMVEKNQKRSNKKKI